MNREQAKSGARLEISDLKYLRFQRGGNKTGELWQWLRPENDATAFRVALIRGTLTQGSSFLATLGWYDTNPVGIAILDLE
jgi:hypothetical protein